MTQAYNNFHISRNLWLSMLVSVLVPLLLGLVLSEYLSTWSWVHYPLHAMVESVGSLSALIIAILMITMINNNTLPAFYTWVACALIGMGILDGFHAVLHSGVSFVWLHSIATLVGGVTFAAIWLPHSWLKPERQKFILLIFILLSTVICLFSIAAPEKLPAMIINGEFSTLAAILNITGGIGFIAGSAYFVYCHYKDSFSHQQRQREDLVFANHCLLFGIAGLLFETSVIWDAGWWWWHILRLLAYLIVLIYFLYLFKKQQDTLRQNEIMLSDANKNLEQRVYERTKELEKANQAKSEFLSSMSHELRTPLNAVLGFTQLMQLDKQITATNKKYTTEILHAGNHLLMLINEVLELEKIEEGNLDIDLRYTEITKIIKNSISTMSPLAKQKNIQLINNIAGDDKYIVNIDKLRFKQIVINLLSNSIKYNVKGGEVIIDINVTDNKIRINFKDTGPGISQEKQEKLFIPFERLGYETSAVEGAGIGLVLCKKLVELMNGTVGMHSVPGQGSIFYIELPYYL